MAQYTINDYETVNQSSGLVLNAGLPWTNPLKLQIGADEHILDTTINRGLMMLLNNDYYLDIKANVLSQELSTTIKNEDVLKDVLERHINDDSIHGKTSLTTTIINNYDNSSTTSVSIGQNTYNSDALTRDTVKYLPITYSASQLNKIIRDTPHNLNRFQSRVFICSA